MVTRIIPSNERGFIIEISDDGNRLSFAEQPAGNTRTPRQVLDDNAAKTNPPAKRQLTRTQVDAELRQKFLDENNIEEVP